MMSCHHPCGSGEEKLNRPLPCAIQAKQEHTLINILCWWTLWVPQAGKKLSGRDVDSGMQTMHHMWLDNSWWGLRVLLFVPLGGSPTTSSGRSALDCGGAAGVVVTRAGERGSGGALLHNSEVLPAQDEKRELLAMYHLWISDASAAGPAFLSVQISSHLWEKQKSPLMVT